MTTDPATERRANARVSRGEKASMEAFVTGSLGAYRRMTLWTWVGGAVSLGATSLVFRPNQLNLAFESGDDGLLGDAEPFAIEIPLAAVTAVKVTGGPFTRIHVVTVRGTLSLRCSGAHALAEVIRSHSPAGAAGGPRT